jgi:hypothetical protein
MVPDLSNREDGIFIFGMGKEWVERVGWLDEFSF